ncbi:MAG: hypothetical protein SH859_14940 [Hyphomicrobium aestuarii]|nr:hypothetical protein [Hyphomicrobium aestuarii]
MTTHHLFASLTSALTAVAVVFSLSSPAAAQDRYPNDGAGLIRDGYPEPVQPPGDDDREPLRGSSKDDEPPLPPVRRYRQTADCLTKPALRLALKEQGWHNFDAVEYRDRSSIMTADNDRGRRFEVEFDACSGDVVGARPLAVHVEAPLPPPPVVRYYERPRFYRDHGYREHGYRNDGYRNYGYRHFGPRPFVGVHAHRRWDHRR